MNDPIYIRLFHGRTTPEEELSDWGSDGPVIGPVRVGWTYGNLELFDVDWNDFQHMPEIKGLAWFDGVYYGDMDFMTDGDESLEHHKKSGTRFVPHAEYIEIVRKFVREMEAKQCN